MDEHCECCDGGCPCCHGSCENAATTTLYRVDMEDQTGTLMCDGCADDAMESGVFGTDDDNEGDEFDKPL